MPEAEFLVLPACFSAVSLQDLQEPDYSHVVQSKPWLSYVPFPVQ